MMTALVVYITVGLVLGSLAACAAWAEIRIQHNEQSGALDRAEGRGTFKSPAYSVIGIGLFSAVFWPLMIIEVSP